MKTLIVLSAVPGSGKSTWSEQYRLTHSNVYIVSSDAIRLEISGKFSNLSKEEETKTWEKYYEDILKYRDIDKDVTVIADSTNLSNYWRLMFKDKVTGFDKLVLVIFKKDLVTLLEQNKNRLKEKIVPEEVVKNMYSRFEEVNEEVKNYYDEIIYIDKWFQCDKVSESFHYKK